LKYEAITCRICGPVDRQPALPWQPFYALLVGVSSLCYPPSIKSIGPPSTELLRFYLNTLRDLVTLT